MAQPVQIIITLTPNGELNVSGPFGNLVLFYGLLERARDVVKDAHDKRVAAGPNLIIPTTVLPPNIGNGGKG